MEKFCEQCGNKLVKGKCPNCSKVTKNTKFSNNGVIDRKAIKAEAREKIKGNIWNLCKPLLAFLIYGLIVGILGETLGEESNSFLIIESILSLLIVPISAGLILYYLNFVRNKEFKLEDLLKFYKDGRFIVAILLSVLIGLFTTLWSLLLIIPGIIAALSYSMSVYLFVDEENPNPMSLIKKSKEMMDGYKWDYLVFDLSFILWELAGALTFGLLYIYVIPYQLTAQTMYYEELKNIKKIN